MSQMADALTSFILISRRPLIASIWNHYGRSWGYDIPAVHLKHCRKTQVAAPEQEMATPTRSAYW